MGATINTPIYIDKSLILDLYSIFSDGYIDSREVFCANSGDSNLRVQSTHRDGESEDNKKTDTKDKNIVTDKGNNSLDECTACLDNKNSCTNQIRTKKIYTSFHIFNKVKENMKKDNMLKTIKNTQIKNNNIGYGEYIEFEGNISSISIQSQINTVINIFESYDTKILDKLLMEKDEEPPLTNYSVILKQLKNLSDLLSKNSTVTMTVENNQFKSILNVNLNYFLDKNSYIYDQVNCRCRVLCKVSKVTNENECINLLDKTCMSDYYEKLLESLKSYLDVLEKNNIIVPQILEVKVNYPSIQAIPLAMYI